jgi:hypothetical protein
MLFLTVKAQFDWDQISGWYTRFMRDEVLGEWVQNEDSLELHVHCHVSGGIVLGTAAWRERIFRHELPLVLEAMRHSDDALFRAQPDLDQAPVWVHFHTRQRASDRLERWGALGDYR